MIFYLELESKFINCKVSGGFNPEKSWVQKVPRGVKLQFCEIRRLSDNSQQVTYLAVTTIIF